MIVTCKRTPTLSRKSIQKSSEVLTSIEPNENHSTFHLNLQKDSSFHPTQKQSTLSKLSCTRRYRLLTSEIISVTFALLALVVLVPNGTLSAPSPIQNEGDVSTLEQKVALLPVNSHSLVLEDFADPSIIEGHRMKRDAYEDEEPVEDFYDTNDDNMEIGKRSSGNNRARRVSMMRLKKDLLRLQYPKRMSMMRLRRDYLPFYGNNRETRAKVSMLRLRRGTPSYMRLKKMTQMRLKRMTQMRLKKSGVSQFGDSFDDDSAGMASEDKRDAELQSPVVIASDQEGAY